MLCFNFPINVQNDCLSGILINLGYVLLHVTVLKPRVSLLFIGFWGLRVHWHCFVFWCDENKAVASILFDRF